MNRRENSILMRLYSIMNAIPGANLAGSTQSASVHGVITFAKDMSAVKEPFSFTLYYLRVGEYEEAEEKLTLMEAWVAERQGSEWIDAYPFPRIPSTLEEGVPPDPTDIIGNQGPTVS